MWTLGSECSSPNLYRVRTPDRTGWGELQQHRQMSPEMVWLIKKRCRGDWLLRNTSFHLSLAQGANHEVIVTSPKPVTTRVTPSLVTARESEVKHERVCVCICFCEYMGLSAGQHTGKHRYTECDGVLEHFEDTGSAEKHRKRLWMAVPNEIDSALKIYKHAVTTLQLLRRFFSNYSSPFATVVTSVGGNLKKRRCNLPCCAHICRGPWATLRLGSWPAWTWRCSDTPVW